MLKQFMMREVRIILLTLTLDKNKKSSLGNFLLQECEKFNNLMDVIKSTLGQLKLAITGKIVMSALLEKIYYSFLENKVPQVN